MTFHNPLVLLALGAVPVLVALYLSHERRRRAGAAAFAQPRLAASVAPSRPGWRRHAPIAVLLLALAVLVVAAARPQTTVAVPDERASIMLVTDVSGSMLATDVAPTRLIAAQRAAQRFVARVPRQVNIGIMAFNQVATVLQSPTRDRADVAAALARLQPSGGTATGEAIRTAVRILTRPAADGRRPPAAIVLLSDGASTRGVSPITAARAAGRAHVPIWTVALGTATGTIQVPRPGGAPGTETRRVPPDPASLREVARLSGGSASTAAAATKLDAVYKRLGSQLGRRDERREITTAFAGGAALLLALAGAMSLSWFGRLV